MSLKHIFIVLCLSLEATCAWSQVASNSVKPHWLTTGLPVPENNTFIYVRETATGKSLQEAYMECEKALANEMALLNRVSVETETISHDYFCSHQDDSQYSETLDSQMMIYIKVKGSPSYLQAKRIDDHWEYVSENNQTVIRASVLYQAAVKRAPIFTEPRKTNLYADDPANWGLMLIPGASQMYKGSYLKGGLIMGGAVLMAGGIVTFESLRSDYLGKIATTHSAETKKAYYDTANGMEIGRNICIGAAAALYVYNIIDALVAPGARRIIVYPSATPTGEYGMAIRYNF